MPKRWPTDPSFRAFKGEKGGLLKADRSELVFKDVLSAAAGSTFLQHYENKMHQSEKYRSKLHLGNYIFDVASVILVVVLLIGL